MKQWQKQIQDLRTYKRDKSLEGKAISVAGECDSEFLDALEKFIPTLIISPKLFPLLEDNKVQIEWETKSENIYLEIEITKDKLLNNLPMEFYFEQKVYTEGKEGEMTTEQINDTLDLFFNGLMEKTTTNPKKPI